MTTENQRKERRRSKRRRRRLAVRFWSGETEGSGFTSDISNTGLMVETTTPANIGDRLHIELELPGGRPFFAEVVVVRKKVYPRQALSMFKPGLALKFVSLGQAIRALTEREADADSRPVCESDKTEAGELRLDLRDSAELKRIYERDIKFGGVQIPTVRRPEVDEEIAIVFELPEPHGTIECRGFVVAHVEQPPSVGVRLQDVDQIRGRLLEILRAG